MRLESDQSADGALLQQLFDGEKIAIPAAIVEGNGEQTLAPGKAYEFERFFAGGGEWLVDDNVFAGLEHALGEGKMGLIGRGHDDQLNGFVGENFIQRTRDFCGRIGFCGCIACALHDGHQAQPGTALTNGA